MPRIREEYVPIKDQRDDLQQYVNHCAALIDKPGNLALRIALLVKERNALRAQIRSIYAPR